MSFMGYNVTKTPLVKPNKALTVVSKQGVNIALTAFQFGGQTRC